MSRDRVPRRELFAALVTPQTKFINRAFEHKLVFRGVWIMTGSTSLTEDDIVDVGKTIFATDQILHVIMTAETKIQGTFRPELISISVTMRVMTERTASEFDDAVHSLA